MEQRDEAGDGVSVSVDGDGIVTLVLDRPQARNALDQRMVAVLSAALTELGARPDVRGLVLRGNGRHFCAGIDLAWMQAGTAEGEARIRADSLAIQSLYRALYEFPRPTAAIVQGAAVAGGLGLACACDMVIAQQGAQFGASEVRLGLIPGMLMPLLVRRLGHGPARQVGALGLTYGADEMKAFGLVSRIGEDADAVERLWAPVREAMLATSPDAVADFKRSFDRLDWGVLADVFDQCLEDMVASRLSASAQRGLAAVARRETPDWRATASRDGALA